MSIHTIKIANLREASFWQPILCRSYYRNTVREGAMTKKNSSHKSAAVSRRTLLQAGAATIGAAAFPMPGIAQTKPFAGVTLRGASFQHRFVTLLTINMPVFEPQTGINGDRK